MRACIIIFSPSGHTRTVAERLRKELTDRDVFTQLLDVTGVSEIQKDDEISAYLEEHVEEHDILFIGSPVYAGHFESNMIRMIKKLPTVNEKWGRAVVPFVTYGGLHSSIALLEAGKLISETGRVTVAGLKIAAFHTLTAKSDKKINSEKPGHEEFAMINEFINVFLSKGNSILTAKDISTQFDYIPVEEKQLYLSKSQDDWHQSYRNVTIDADKCSKCQLCIKKCPVTRYSLNDREGIVEVDADIKCILCAECFHNCPSNAIRFPYIIAVKERMSNSTAAHLEKIQNAYFI